MDASRSCTAWRLGEFAIRDALSSFLVDGMVDGTENRLEEGQCKDCKTQLRMCIVPNTVRRCLPSEPNTHASSNDIDDIADDLANGVDLDNDRILQIKSEEDCQRRDEKDPDEGGQNSMGDEYSRCFVELGWV